MDINKIQSALQLLKEEHEHIEEYLQNAAAKKKELDKERNASFNRYNCKRANLKEETIKGQKSHRDSLIKYGSINPDGPAILNIKQLK